MATLTVGTGGTYSTLAAAQTAASNGDTLEIQPGVYSGAGWADVTISKVLVVMDTAAGCTIQDTTGSALTMQGNGSMLDIRYSAIESSSTGTAIASTGTGVWVRANITNTNASGEALSIASGATGGDYQITAECTAASTSFGIKVSTTGDPGLIHDCRLTGYQYGIEYSGSAQTSHFVRRCIIKGSTRGCSVPYKATLVNCVFDTCTDGMYSGTDVTVHHCTFVACGDGIHALAVGQYLAVKNSIFNGCSAGLRGVAGDEVAPDYCNFSDNVADVVNWTAPTNSVVGDPLIDSVTYEPAEGSPVIDAGTDLGYTDDLYHTSAWRPQGTAPDVGAVEREVSLPPEPPSPLTGRRHEVHRIWPGGSVGTVTIGATDYAVIVPRARENLHLWVARVVVALETATGLDWSGWLTSDLKLCIGCGVAFDWTGTVAGNAFSGWADSTAPAAPDRGFLLTGTANAAAERLCAVKLSWPVLHAYRTVQVHPAASPVLIAAAYRTPSIDFEATLYVGQTNQCPLWVSEEWCLYRGTDAEVNAYTDTDGWLVLRPIDEGNRAGLPLDAWAGTITYTRNFTWVAA